MLSPYNQNLLNLSKIQQINDAEPEQMINDHVFETLETPRN